MKPKGAAVNMGDLKRGQGREEETGVAMIATSQREDQ